MAKSQIKASTIVASSTDNAWSQAYHAGGVTAVISVRRTAATDESPSLSIVGKDLLNTFESEYFTLETKNLTSIKQAVEVTYQKSKETHDISLVVTASIQNAVYVVLAGTGKILLIRKGALATLLEQRAGDNVLSASGFLDSGDIMVLETLSFEEKVPTESLLETLTTNSITDAAEILSPNIHRDKDGSAAALIFTYHEETPVMVATNPISAPPTLNEQPEQKGEETAIRKEDIMEEVGRDPFLDTPAPPRKTTKKKLRLTHRQKIFLTIAVVLAIVFASAIYFSLQKKQMTQNTTLFSQLYPPAERKYAEGQGLQDLNASLAHDDYIQAQQMLQAAKDKFPANSSEENQILALLDKVNAQLTPTSTPQQTNVTKIDATTDPFLGFAAKVTSAKYFAQDDTNYYVADATGIIKTTKSTSTQKQIITNSGDWKSLGGFQTYLGNMYILDTADGIDKYTAGSNGFGNKSAYFSGKAPDLSKAVSMAIDGSVWILSSDGSITKYTRGIQDPFTITGLSTPLSTPTQLISTVDDANIYILDAGNGRIVSIKKDGTFVADYTNSLIKNATQLDVQESGKKAYFLSGGNIYQIDLK